MRLTPECGDIREAVSSAAVLQCANKIELVDPPRSFQLQRWEEEEEATREKCPVARGSQKKGGGAAAEAAAAAAASEHSRGN